MEQETASALRKWSTRASAVTAILALLFGIWKVDDRYAKATTIKEAMSENKNAIIAETRREIVKNRTAMIATMEREYDDLEYEMTVMEDDEIPVPRYLREKQKQLSRDINALRSQ